MKPDKIYLEMDKSTIGDLKHRAIISEVLKFYIFNFVTDKNREEIINQIYCSMVLENENE